MERLQLSELAPGVRLTRALYHASGEVLLEAGSVVTTAAVRLMAAAGIEAVIQRGRGEDQQDFVLAIRNKVVPVSDLKSGQRMDMPLYDREGVLLAKAGTVITRGMGNKLRQRRERCVYARKGADELKREQFEAYLRGMARLARLRPPPVRGDIDPSRLIDPEDCTVRGLGKLPASGEAESAPAEPGRVPGWLRVHHPLESRSELARDACLAVYEEALGRLAAFFRAIELGRDIAGDPVGTLASELVGALLTDRELLLGLHGLETPGDYLPGHSLGVATLAIAAAAARGYDRQLVLEMAQAALLHDIGMLRVPGGIVNRPRKLSRMEVLQIRKHPLHALNLLRPLAGRRGGLAASIPVVAYQAHERENGLGYPQGCTGGTIHDFARIVAVCDVYQALASRRPWRAALLPYQAMEQVVLMGGNRELDGGIIRALLGCVSLFPIGSWVELADGALARVVAAGEKDFARPTVSVMYRGGQRLPRPQRLSLSQHPDAAIASPAAPPPDSPHPLDGF